VLPDGTKNTGKRCRVVTHLDKGHSVDVAIEIYKNEDQISEVDLMVVELSH